MLTFHLFLLSLHTRLLNFLVPQSRFLIFSSFPPKWKFPQVPASFFQISFLFHLLFFSHQGQHRISAFHSLQIGATPYKMQLEEHLPHFVHSYRLLVGQPANVEQHSQL